jgi:uncharacterized surface protein with fasciclin (FAS1) repeats
MKLIKYITTAFTLLLMSSFALAAHHDEMMTKPEKTIAQIALANPDLSTLVTALKAADLVNTLNSKGHYTVFAPTNEAFAKLPKVTLANLLKPENKDKLKSVLLYHVVGNELTATEVASDKSIKTLEGSSIKVKANKSGVTLNKNAKVTMTDIKASNGIIHVINTVLLPPKK